MAPRWVFGDGTDRRVAQAILLREGGEFSVAIARQTAQRSDPQAAVFGRPQRPDAVARQRAVLFVEDHEVVAVELRQPLVGADPQVAVLGLCDGAHGVLRKAVFLGPDGSGVLRQRAARIQGGRRLNQRAQRHDGEEDLWQHF